MGEVYRATDTKLGRDVALKILPASFTDDPERVARFRREAQVLASLNHPHIAQIYGLEETNGAQFLVLELVDDESLDKRIARGKLPLDEALEIAKQIAEALEAAHEKGIIHRDLKPANIALTRDGSVKVLDFGLAKAVESTGSAFELANSPTSTSPAMMTGVGVILGTAAYMSPEQAKGRAADRRSDIWAFGCVLYEMLTGKRAFGGDDVTDTIVAVVSKEPDWTLLPVTIASSIRPLLTRCLKKDSKGRLRDIGDARIHIDELLSGASQEPVAIPNSHSMLGARSRWASIGVATVALFVGGAGVLWLRTPREPFATLSLRRFTADHNLALTPAISADGRLIAYASDRAGNGDLDIWVQHRGGSDAIRVTNDPSDEFQPSFSPDGSQIVYTGGDGIYIVPALGGDRRRIVQSSTPRGHRPRFSPDGKRIVYRSGLPSRSLLWLVDIGGSPQPLAADRSVPDSPVWSPDGRYILFEASPSLLEFTSRDWWLLTVADGKSVRLGESPGVPEQWLADGSVLFSTEPRSDSLMRDHADVSRVRLSLQSHRLLGPPEPLTAGTGLLMDASAASDGAVVLSAGTMHTDLWSLPIDANTARLRGEPAPITQDFAIKAYPSISADGRKLAYVSDVSGIEKTWIMDLTTGTRRMLTANAETEFRPAISPDGRLVAFAGIPLAGVQYLVDASDMEQPSERRRICDTQCFVVWDWTPDQRSLIIATRSSGGTSPVGVGLLAPSGGVPVPILQDAPSRVFQVHVSPDGRWMLLLVGGLMKLVPLSNGKPSGSAQWRTLVQGESDLYRWSPDGNTVYFLSTRDGFRCVWAQRLNATTKEPVGDPFAIYHAHGARRSMQGLSDNGAIGLAVARDKIVFTQAEHDGSIYIGTLKTAGQ